MRAFVALLFAPCALAVACAPQCPKPITPVTFGAATDDVLDVLTGAPVTVDDTKGFVFEVPAEGAQYSAADAPPEWTWKKGPARHLPPVSGEIFWLRAHLPNGCDFDMATMASTLQLDDASWATLVLTKGKVTLELVRAYVQDNRIVEPPVRVAKPRTITVR